MSVEAGPPDLLVDFYAGAIAATAVVLFAKFITHSRHRPRRWGWWVAHWLCVVAAWIGLVFSMAELSDLHPFFLKESQGQEETIRRLVLWAVVVAGTIFAVDVAWAGRSQKTSDESRPVPARHVNPESPGQGANRNQDL